MSFKILSSTSVGFSKTFTLSFAISSFPSRTLHIEEVDDHSTSSSASWLLCVLRLVHQFQRRTPDNFACILLLRWRRTVIISISSIAAGSTTIIATLTASSATITTITATSTTSTAIFVVLTNWFPVTTIEKLFHFGDEFKLRCDISFLLVF